jgi:hypothetical protein
VRDRFTTVGPDMPDNNVEAAADGGGVFLASASEFKNSTKPGEKKPASSDVKPDSEVAISV